MAGERRITKGQCDFEDCIGELNPSAQQCLNPIGGGPPSWSLSEITGAVASDQYALHHLNSSRAHHSHDRQTSTSAISSALHKLSRTSAPFFFLWRWRMSPTRTAGYTATKAVTWFHRCLVSTLRVLAQTRVVLSVLRLKMRIVSSRWCRRV